MDFVKNRQDLPVMMAKAGRNEHAVGLYTKKGAYLLRLKNMMQIEQFIKEGSKDYRGLDALILKAFVLDKLEIKSEDITYCNMDVEGCFSAVDNGQGGAQIVGDDMQQFFLALLHGAQGGNVGLRITLILALEIAGKRNVFDDAAAL